MADMTPYTLTNLKVLRTDLGNEAVAIHEVEFKSEEVTLTANLVLPHRAPREAKFGVKSVFKDGKRLWSFPASLRRKVRAYLAPVGDEVVIALSNLNGCVQHVEPLRSLLLGIPMSHQRSLAYKQGAAKALGMTCQLTPPEHAIARNEAARRRAEEAACIQSERAAEEAKKAKKVEERARRRATILLREKVDVELEDGSRVNGFPVGEEEWACLENGTRCVLRDGSVFTHHFVVDKSKSGKVSKARVHPIARVVPPKETEKPARAAEKKTSARPKPMERRNFRIRDEDFPVNVFRSLEELEVLKEIGHPGVERRIELVAVKQEAGKYAVYALKTEKGTTVLGRIGEMSPINRRDQAKAA